MESIVARPYSRKALFYLSASVILAACFTWIIIDARGGSDVSFAYGGVALFGVSALFLVSVGLPGSTFLKAHNEGIEVRFLWVRAFSFGWSEIKDFTAGSLSTSFGPEAILYIRLSPLGIEKDHGSLFQRITHGRLGVNRGLPNIFKSAPSELARVLNETKMAYELQANSGVQRTRARAARAADAER